MFALTYQAGLGDQFIYSYSYDADNRVIGVNTSRDNVLWTNDASYRYYLHGPLARVELGQYKVQGIDYAYTLQGWLKAINGHRLLSTQDTLADMNQDGWRGTPYSTVARDVYAFGLGYFSGDYDPNGGTNAHALSVTYSTPVPGYEVMGNGLYNGNISHSTLALSVLDSSTMVGYTYRYDQLNRMIQMRRHASLAGSASTWDNTSIIDDYRESVSYDPNGNILTYHRNGPSSPNLAMDQLTYSYQPNTNRLDNIADSVPASNYTVDIDNQNPGNYKYDQIGNLIYDSASQIFNVQWSVYGKLKSVSKIGFQPVNYAYNPAGQRIYKHYQTDTSEGKEFYVRDAQGNVLAVYDLNSLSQAFTWNEQDLYGSNRLGLWEARMPIPQPITWTNVVDSLQVGQRSYELTNHLENVLGVISDKKKALPLNDTLVDHYVAEVLSQSDYYPFGMLMPGRSYDAVSLYRYGFNGQEGDKEIAGRGNAYTAEYWEYDPRVGRRWNLDPKPIDGVSEYSAFNNSPITIDDPLGDTVKIFGTAEVTNTTLSDKGGTADQGQNAITFKDAKLVPAVDPNNNNKLIGYNVFDTKNTGRDMPILQIEPGDIEDFKTNYNGYMGGARLYYSNGEPSDGMKKLAAALDLSNGGVNWKLAWEGIKQENKEAWSDPVFVASVLLMTADAGVGSMRSKPILRQAYESEVRGLSKVVSDMRSAGNSSEDIARTVHGLRRGLGVTYKDLTPPDMLEKIYERNLTKYGDKLGPTIDYLRSRGKSWEDIIESAIRPGGKDLGF